jgi:hypothetical protein
MHGFTLFLGLATAAFAVEPLTFSSGTKRVHLLELYTSEGCSSCPPAEEWLGDLRTQPGLWHDFVPVAFHVAFWDQLGWRDRFASREFTDREYRYAGEWGTGSVYTPCFVLDGAEWRADFRRTAPAASGEEAYLLTARYENAGRVKITCARTDRGFHEVHVAILGGGVVSAVRAGENKGRTLHHEFIMLAAKNAPLVAGGAEFELPVPEIPGVARHALAVWITRVGGATPLQATGGWLD